MVHPLATDTHNGQTYITPLFVSGVKIVRIENYSKLNVLVSSHKSTSGLKTCVTVYPETDPEFRFGGGLVPDD